MISTATGRVAVRVIHTDEEFMIAKTVCSVSASAERMEIQLEDGNDGRNLTD